MLYDLWVISPAILIPAVIILAVKKKKLEGFILQLLRLGRISQWEYFNKTPQPRVPRFDPDTGKPLNAPYMQNIPAAPTAGTPRVTARPAQPQMQPQNYPYRDPGFVYANTNAAAFVPVKQKKEKKPISAEALLVIGALLIALAGMVFSFANWLSMSELSRTGVIALTAALFFGLSAFTRKKLSLDNASMTFYILGAVFASTALLTAGYFELFGKWFSTSGDGAALLFAAAALVMSLLFHRAQKLFSKSGFIHAGLYGAMLSYSFFALQIFTDPSAWVLSLNAASALTVFAVYKTTKFSDNSPYSLFAVIISSIYALFGMVTLAVTFADGWSVFGWLILLLWLVQLIAYGVKLPKAKILLAASPLLIISAAVQAGISAVINDLADLTDLCTITSAIIFIAGLIYVFVKKLRTDLSDYAYPISLMIAFFTSLSLNVYEEYLPLAAIALMLLVLCAVTAVFSNSSLTRGLTYALPIPIIMTAASLSFACFEQHNIRIFFIQITLAAFGGLLFYGKKLPAVNRLHSAASDILLPTVSAMIYVCYAFSEKYLFLIPIGTAAAVILTACFCFEKTNAPHIKALRYILALMICFALAPSLGFTASVSSNRFWQERDVLTAVLAVFAASFAFLCIPAAKKDLRTPLSDILFPAVILICANGYTITRLYPYQGLVMLLLSFAAALTASVKKETSPHLTLLRALTPLPLMFLSDSLKNILKTDFPMADMIIVTLVISALAILFVYLSDKHRHITAMRYSFIAAASICSYYITDHTKELSLLIIFTAVTCLLYYLSAVSKNTLVGIIPMIALYGSCSQFSYILANDQNRSYLPFICISITMLLLAAASRTLYSKALINRQNGGFRADIAGFAAGIAPLYCLSFYEKGASFTALILASLFFANLCRRDNKSDTNRILLTVSCALLCLSFYARPFLLPNDEAVTLDLIGKLDLIPPLVFAAAVQRIWQGRKTAASTLAFLANLSALIMLVIDTFIISTLANTILTLVILLAVMLIAYIRKSARWFAVSAAFFAGITLYITKDLFAAAGWLFYLIFAGILLISIAAASEYFRTHPDKLKALKEKLSKK